MFSPMLPDVIPGNRGGMYAGRHFNTLDVVLRDGMDAVRHSCDPSCGLTVRDGGHLLIAIRPINAMQEITIDLSTWRDGQEEMPCNCLMPLCRQTITDFSKLAQRIKDRYLRIEVVNPEFLKRWKPSS